MSCLIGALIGAMVGVEAMVRHFRFGYSAFTPVVFRRPWGVFGGRWSRFASFACAPATLWRHLRGSARCDEHLDVGHGPLGALLVGRAGIVTWVLRLGVAGG